MCAACVCVLTQNKLSLVVLRVKLPPTEHVGTKIRVLRLHAVCVGVRELALRTLALLCFVNAFDQVNRVGFPTWRELPLHAGVVDRVDGGHTNAGSLAAVCAPLIADRTGTLELTAKPVLVSRGCSEKIGLRPDRTYVWVQVRPVAGQE